MVWLKSNITLEINEFLIDANNKSDEKRLLYRGEPLSTRHNARDTPVFNDTELILYHAIW